MKFVVCVSVVVFAVVFCQEGDEYVVPPTDAAAHATTLEPANTGECRSKIVTTYRTYRTYRLKLLLLTDNS